MGEARRPANLGFRPRQAMEKFVFALQEAICAKLAALDGEAQFRQDSWQRAEGGGGLSCVLEDGALFEKAGVNVSVVTGTLSAQAAASMGGGQHLPPGEHLKFFAAGISLIVHPHSPLVPTVHANYRYFERGDDPLHPVAWWFGGGADLTPSYLFDEDAAHFHALHRAACDRHDPAFYARFKAWADEYFYIPHRGERRGVGGIFFDNLNDRSPQELMAFVEDCGAALLPAYVPLVERHKDAPYTPAQRDWQQVRRGRYVEFNLIYDRGTGFGLRTGGRTESILVSLPRTARWNYSPPEPQAGSPEAHLLTACRQPRAWA